MGGERVGACCMHKRGQVWCVHSPRVRGLLRSWWPTWQCYSLLQCMCSLPCTPRPDPARDSGALKVLPRGAYNTTTVTAYRRQQRPQRQATRHHNSTVTTTQKGRARTPDYAYYRSPQTAQPHKSDVYFAGLHGSLPYVERLRLTQCEPCLLGCAKMARALRAPCAFSWPSIA